MSQPLRGDMKIVFATSEAVPFASTGGLGEVSHALPAALRGEGVEVIRVMPMYRQVIEGGHALRDSGIRLKIPVGFRVFVAEVWKTNDDAVPTYFIRRDESFDRRALYALPERDYSDNLERFVFFQKAVVALLDTMGWGADLVHCNDWTCGLIPLYLKHGISGTGRAAKERTVFTVHNLAYQGIFPGAEFPTTNLPFSCFTVQGMEFFGNMNCMKAGLITSNHVTTVSPSYAEEIRSPGQGFGLEGVLRSLGDRFTGVLNGADYKTWCPESDPHIPAPFSADRLQGKASCRGELMRAAGWFTEPDIPIFGMVSRLVPDKGFDLLDQAIEKLVRMPFRMALLGSGQEDVEARCVEWMSRWPHRIHVEIGYNVKHAHRIQAGSDFFLMPSAREPGGLSQLYAMRYGTLPVVHAVGGLRDSVMDLSADGATGNGIVFSGYDPASLMAAIERAGALMRNGTRGMAEIRSRIMREDHSWSQSAKAYLHLYEHVMLQPVR